MATNTSTATRTDNPKPVRRIVQLDEHTFALTDAAGEICEFFNCDDSGQHFAPLDDFVPVLEREFDIALGPVAPFGGAR